MNKLTSTSPFIKSLNLAITSILMLTATSVHAGTIYTDKMLAVVNDDPILYSEVAEAKTAYKASGVNAGNQEILSTLIDQQLQLALAKKFSVTPTDEEVDKQLVAYAKSKGLRSLAELQKVLDKQEAYKYAQLRQDIVDNLSISLLRNNQIASKINLTEKEVDTYLASPEGIKLNQNEYQTVHIRVPFPVELNKLSQQQLAQANAVAKKISADLRLSTDNSNKSIAYILAKHQDKYAVQLQGGNMGFNKANSLPSNLASKIIDLSINEVSQPVTTPKGIDIIKLADKRVGEDMLIPQWRTRHILVAVNDSQNDAMAKNKIRIIYQKLASGKDFAKLAAAYSDDPGSAGNGGDLNWVSEGVMVRPFEQMMKQTPVGRVSQPFKTQFGWHIVQVVNKRTYDASETVRRNMAREILFKRMAPQATKDWLDELKSNAYIKVF